MKLRWGLLGIGAACAACCIPLVLPLLAGVGVLTAGAGGARLLGLSLEQILCYGVPVAGLAAVGLVWWLRRAKARREACDCQDICAVDQCSPATSS